VDVEVGVGEDNSYLPEEVTFYRNGIGNRIADGVPVCHFVLEHHTGK